MPLHIVKLGAYPAGGFSFHLNRTSWRSRRCFYVSFRLSGGFRDAAFLLEPDGGQLVVWLTRAHVANKNNFFMGQKLTLVMFPDV